MATRYVSFDEVKARISIEQLLEHYGLLDDRIKRNGDELALHCVFHANDKTPSLKVNTAKNIFHCFGCDQGGDVLAFVVLKEDIATGDADRDRREAALRLQEWFGLSPSLQRSKSHTGRKSRQQRKVTGSDRQGKEGGIEPKAESPEGKGAGQSEPAGDAEDAAVVNPPLMFTLKNLDPEHPYLAARGLTKETITTFGIGYHAGKGTMHGRIAIPIHNEQGELVAYAGRWPDDNSWPEGEEKYKMPSRENGFYKSHLLYNLHRAKDYAGEGLIVVEGFFAVFDLWQKGRRNVVAVMGSHVSPAQEKRIAAMVGPKGRVLLAFDPDDAGRKGMKDAADRLVSQVFVRIIELGS